MMEHVREFDDLQDAYIEMLEYEIMLVALQRISKSNFLDPALKKKLLFLMSLSNEEVIKLSEQDGHEINLLGLPQEKLSQLSNIDFSLKEKKLIRELFFKELPKVTKELSDCVIEFDSEITSNLDVYKVAQDLQKVVLNCNGEIENLVEKQNKLIDTKYNKILAEQIKKVELSEAEIINTSQIARDLYEKTLQAVYPSEEYYDKINQAATSLEKELDEVNKELEDLQSTKEMYLKLNQQEFKSLVNQYKEVMKEIQMKEMALKELKLFDNTSGIGASLEGNQSNESQDDF